MRRDEALRDAEAEGAAPMGRAPHVVEWCWQSRPMEWLVRAVGEIAAPAKAGFCDESSASFPPLVSRCYGSVFGSIPPTWLETSS